MSLAMARKVGVLLSSASVAVPSTSSYPASTSTVGFLHTARVSVLHVAVASGPALRLLGTADLDDPAQVLRVDRRGR